jgi:hypothetical protein
METRNNICVLDSNHPAGIAKHGCYDNGLD